MNDVTKPQNYWTKEKCHEEALKYTSRTEFQKKSRHAYNSSRKNGWLDEVCQHVESKIMPKGYLTKERCQNEALKYTSRTEFRKKRYNIYKISRKNGWLSDVCQHMEQKIMPSGYWTKEQCQTEALKYCSRVEFKKKSSASYSISVRKGWHNEICQHMTYKQLPNGYWTKEKCHEEALKYDTRVKFKKNSESAYSIAYVKGWLNDICTHMLILQLPNNYWTIEKCSVEALKYEMRKDFRFNSGAAHSAAYKNGWLNDICMHMHKKPQLGDYWTKEKCHEEALKYKTKIEFKRKCRQVYEISRNNKWINDISTHMVSLKKPISYWTEENCRKEALKYQYKTEYITHSQKAYSIAQKNGWNKEHCSHMITLGDKYNRLIYVYEFSDNYAYVGLTFNLERRNAKHLSLTEIRTTPVAKHIIETNLIPKLIKLTEYLPVKGAQDLEIQYIEKYKNDGWILLNKLIGGGLGSSRKTNKK